MNRKRIFSTLLVLALLVCMLPAAAYAAPKSTAAPVSTPKPTAASKAADKSDAASASAAAKTADAAETFVINEAGETLYNDGDTVFNNYGIVYNNGGVVYNNGGTVFNNSGTVYNNGGVVYNNGAMVYNNNGTVYNNDGDVEDNAGKLPAMADGSGAVAAEVYEITLADDYGALADISGLIEDTDGKTWIESGGECVITPKPGVEITDAVTTAGACMSDDDGVVTLKNVDRDGKLTLKFKLAAPVITPEAGSYYNDLELSIEAPAEAAEIYYTTDGSDPTSESEKYTGPFEIDSSMVVKAIAVAGGAANSDITEESYLYPVIKDIKFDNAAVGYRQPDAKALVVKNTGLGELVIESVSLEGDDKDCFKLSTEKGGTVATGQSDSKTWTVVPNKGLAAGEYEAEAVFTFDSGDTARVEISFKVTKTADKKA